MLSLLGNSPRFLWSFSPVQVPHGDLSTRGLLVVAVAHRDPVSRVQAPKYRRPLGFRIARYGHRICAGRFRSLFTKLVVLV